jgi:hypothetical protein
VTKLTDFVVFQDRDLAARYASGKMPMTALFEAYLDGDVDIPDMDTFLDARQDVVTYGLTKHHFEFLFTRFIPEVAIHSKAQDERIVREHYDRGDDFFDAFLGERMVYTSAFFRDSERARRALRSAKTRQHSEMRASRRPDSPTARASNALITGRSPGASTTAFRAWRWSSTSG